MRGAIVIAAAALLALGLGDVALAEKPAKGVKDCKLSDHPVNIQPHRALLLPDGRLAGGARAVFACAARDARTGKKIPGSEFYYRDGLAMIDGQVLVPRQYDQVIPYSNTAAFVLREDGRWARYRFGKGEEQVPTGHTAFGDLSPVMKDCVLPAGQQAINPVAAYSMTAPDAAGRRDVAVYSSDGAPAFLTSLGGPGIERPVERHRDVLIAHWIDASGAARSRLYTLTGEPLSPDLGRVERWATSVIPGQRGAVCSFLHDAGLYVAGPSLDPDPNKPVFGSLMLPIDDRGRPKALPAGAVGVAPLPMKFNGPDRLPVEGWGQTQVWAVVFPAGAGFQFTLTQGSLDAALAVAPREPRYDRMARVPYQTTSLSGERRDNAYISHAAVGETQWRGRQYDYWNIVGPPAATAVDAGYRAGSAVQSLQADARNAQLKAQQVLDNKRYEAALAAGTACTLPAPIAYVDDAIIFAHAKACPQNYSLSQRQWLKWRGASPALVTGVDAALARAEQAAAAQQAEWAEQARNYVSRDAMWRLAGDAWIKGMTDRADAGKEQREKQYQADWQRSQRAY